MEELDLANIYRKLHPNTKAFMYKSKSLNLELTFTTFFVCYAIHSSDWHANIFII